MKNRIKSAITCIFILSAFICRNTVEAQQCSLDFEVEVVQHSTCPANGIVKVTATGGTVDLSNVFITLAGSGINEMASANGYSFGTLPPGNYEVNVQSVCQGTQNVVHAQPQTVTVLSQYDAMIATVAPNKRNSLNCMNSGRVSIDIGDGRPPYKIEITSKPDEYTGETVFEVSGPVALESLAPGNYVFSVSDDCGYTRLLNATIDKLDSDFPAEPFESYLSPSGCRQAYFRENSEDSHEYWAYYRHFYEIAYTFDGTKEWSSYFPYQYYVDLPQPYKDMYASGAKMQIYLRLKDTECEEKLVSEIGFNEPVLPAVYSYYNRLCDSYSLSFDLGGDEYLLCKPLKWEIFDASNTLVDSNTDIEYFYTQSIDNLLYNEAYTIKITDNNGTVITGEPVNIEKSEPGAWWWDSDRFTYTYNLSYETYNMCTPHKWEIYDADSVFIRGSEEDITENYGIIEGLEYDREYIINIFDYSGNMKSFHHQSASPPRYIVWSYQDGGDYPLSCEDYRVAVEPVNVNIPYTWTVRDKDGAELYSGTSNEPYNTLPPLPYGDIHIIEITDGITVVQYELSRPSPYPSFVNYEYRKHTCDDYEFYYQIENLFCLPYELEIFDSNGNLIGEKSKSGVTGLIDSVRLEYDMQYTIKITDSKNRTIEFYPQRMSSDMYPEFAYSWEYDLQCSDYERFFYVYNISCFPYKWEIFDGDGVLVDSREGLFELNEYYYLRFEYNKDYTIKVTDAKGRESSNYPFRIDKETATTYNFYINSYMSNCVSESYPGYISLSGQFDSGTRVRFASGPQTPLHADTVLEEDILYFYPFSENYSYSEYLPIAAGEYVFEITDKCGDIHTLKVLHNKSMEVTNLGYTADEITEICEGKTRIYPQGQVYDNGYSVNTYFTVLKSPGDPQVPAGLTIASGEYFLFSKTGRYVFEAKGYSMWDCGIDTVAIDYVKKSLEMDGRTSYVCETGSTGHIRIQGKGGKAPYIYTLLHSDGITPVEGIEPNSTGAFDYGAFGEKYVVRIQDACGTFIPISVEITTLDQTALLSGNTNYCKGETIELSCLLLGATEYEWSGPLGFSASGRIPPPIPDVTKGHSGEYTVRVKPAGCDIFFEGSITIEVHDPPPPEISDISLCRADADMQLPVEPSGSAYSIKWYDENKNPLAEAPTVDLRNTGEYVFYASQFEDAFSCESDLKKITATVRPLPEKSADATGWSCADGYTEITVNNVVSGYLYTVFTDAGATNAIHTFTGTEENTVTRVLPVTITENTAFYLQTSLAGCSLPPEVFQIVSGVFSGVAGDDQTICENTVPLPLTSTPAAGGTGAYTYQWQQKNSEGEWIDIAGATADSYAPPALAASSTYRLKTTGGTNPCDTVFSNEVTVTVAKPFLPGSIAANQTVISGQMPEPLVSTAPASGDEADEFTYLWQYNSGNSGWTDIDGANAETYAPPVSTAVQYRRKVTSTACGVAYSNTVTIAAVRPLSGQYIACESAVVKIGFGTNPGVTYYWYDAETGGNLISGGDPADSVLTVTKDAASVQSLWLEPQYSGATLPRYRIDLLLSDNCGPVDPAGCAATGTVVFREDFGGNSPSDPAIKPAGIPQITDYSYDPGMNGSSKYVIAKTSPNPNPHPDTWYGNIDDHTYPGDYTRGYLMSIDAGVEKGQFYKHKIDGLCVGSQLYFSVWMMSLVKNLEHPDKVNLIFEITDLNDNVLATYYTGNIPDADDKWKNYGFEFIVPDGQSSVIMTVYNNGTGGIGNDPIIDDIEIRFCTPPVNVVHLTKVDTAVCIGSSFTFEGNYIDDGTLGSDLVYRWERNNGGDVNNPEDWLPVGDENASNTGSLTSDYTIGSVDVSDEAYYRMVVATPANINNYSCRAMSDIVRLQVREITVLPENLPLYKYDIPYSVQLESNAEEAVFSYIGDMVTGIGMNSAGLISGTVTEPADISEAVFTVTVADKNGCEASREYMLRTCSPAPVLPFDTVVYCEGTQASALQAVSPDGYPLRWYDAGMNLLNEAPVPATTAGEQTFYVTQINEALQCESAEAKITVLVNPFPALDFGASASDVCFGGSPSIQLDGMNEKYSYYIYSGNAPYSKLDSLTGVISATASLNDILEGPAVYRISVTDTLGCTSAEWAEVTVDVIKLYIEPEKLPPYYKNTEYEQILLTNAASPVFTLVDGSLPQGISLNTSGTLYGMAPYTDIQNIFTVAVQDLNGCSAEREYVLNGQIVVPKAFTPNGDGENDNFMKGYKVVIFDRLGIEIYKGGDGWDGTYKGKPAAPDIYFYKIEYNDPESGEVKILTGYVGIAIN
jgi:gliding motility-associated-like protein